MKTVEAYECEVCGKVLKYLESMKQHEEMCRWEKEGHAVWVENGNVKHSPKVPEELFGPHGYEFPGRTTNCSFGCGCWAGPWSSGGPVDPLGPCPRNPKKPGEMK